MTLWLFVGSLVLVAGFKSVLLWLIFLVFWPAVLIVWAIVAHVHRGSTHPLKFPAVPMPERSALLLPGIVIGVLVFLTVVLPLIVRIVK